jgi:hypothetical protein
MSFRARSPAGARLLTLAVSGCFAATLQAGTATLPNGASVAVDFDASLPTEYLVPAADLDGLIDVPLSGTASIGVGEPGATIVYVIDRSGSTSSGVGTGCAPILGCEKQFFIQLNSDASSSGSVDLAGVVSYDGSASINLGLTDPASSAVNVAINSLSPGGSTNPSLTGRFVILIRSSTCVV